MTPEHLLIERRLPDTLSEWVIMPAIIRFAGPDEIQKEVVQTGWEADLHYFGGREYRQMVRSMPKRKLLDVDLRLRTAILFLYPKLSDEQRARLLKETKMTLEWEQIDGRDREVSIFRFFQFIGEDLLESSGILPTPSATAAETASGRPTA